MKNFYVIRAFNVIDGKHTVHIVKAETEEQAKEMIPGGLEILDIKLK